MRVPVVLVVCVAALLAAAPAHAATTTIGFEDLAGGTVVTEQYRASAATRFGRGLGGPQGNALTVGTPPAGTTAGSRALGLTTCSLGIEFSTCVTDAWFTFERPQRGVAFTLGFETAQSGSVEVTATALDASGKTVDSELVAADNGVDRVVALTVPASEDAIAAIHLTATSLGGAADRRFVALDQLQVDTAAPLSPEIGLVREGDGEVVVTEGGKATVAFTVGRTGGSTGPVALTVTNVPAGTVAELKPATTSGPDGARVELEVNVNSNAGLTTGTLLVTATPSGPATGTRARSVAVPLRVQDGYDLQLSTLWPLQAVNTPVTDGPRPGFSQAYGGVPLVAGKKTVVRVFASARFAARPVSGVRVRLTGTRGGQPLPGSPLVADGGSPLSVLGPAALGQQSVAEQLLGLTGSGPGVPYTFALPASWTTGTIALRAEVLAPPGPVVLGRPPEQAPFACCALDDAAALTDLAFVETRPLQIAAIRTFWSRTRGGKTESSVPLPASSASVFAAARAVTPLSDADFQLIGPNGWSGELDLSGAASQPGNDGADPQNDTAFGLLWGFEQFRAFSERKQIGDVTIAVVDRIARGLESFIGFSVPGDNAYLYSAYFKPIAVTNVARPLTSVGHELGHALTRNHADNGAAGVASCGGDLKDTGGADPGFPRGNGSLGTDALVDTRALFAPVSRVLDPAAGFDLMSYCARSDESNTWISAYGWRQTLDGDPQNFGPFLKPGLRAAAGTRAATRAVTRAAVTAPKRPTRAGIGILAIRDPKGALEQLVTAPSAAGGTQPADPAGAPPGPPVLASLIDASGRVVRSAELTARGAHADADRAQPASAREILIGALPSAGLATAVRMVVRQGGRVLGGRAIGRFTPRVRVTTPRVRRTGAPPRTIALRVRATDRDRQALRLFVDASTNGRTWRMIHGGPARSTIRLDAGLVPVAKRVRLRVRASDGFRTGRATTRPFATRG